MAQYFYVTSVHLNPQTLRTFLEALPKEFELTPDSLPYSYGGYGIGLVADDYAGVLIDCGMFQGDGADINERLNPEDLERIQAILGAPPRSYVSLELAGLPESYEVAEPLVRKMKESWGGVLLDVRNQPVTDQQFFIWSNYQSGTKR